MTDPMNKPDDHLRCTSCGQVDRPRVSRAGPGWIALALWVVAALLMGLPYLLGVAWTIYIGAAALLGALVYTLWYFSRREAACRHCGATHLEPLGGAGAG